MALFWGNVSDSTARRNLRGLLHDIRRLPWLTSLETDGDSIRWRIATDLADFAAAASRSDWQAAVEGIAGPLLSGMEHNATEAYYEWLRIERELQFSRWREVIAARGGEIRGNPSDRIKLALSALKYDAHNERAMQDMVEALRDVGFEDEAWRAYQDFSARLMNDIGVEPTLKMRPVEEASKIPGRQVFVDMPAGGDVGQDRNFIGRRYEQTELVSLLKRGECRLLTLHGPGGVGKSSLARSAMALLSREFPDGIFWIDLEALVSVAQIPMAIVETCGFKSAASRDQVESIATRIGASRMLLIFDNCEHLAGIGALGDTLLRNCTELKILQTSRARTGGAGEWLLPLEGLPVPDAGESELEVIQTFDSIQLFYACAREIEPRFELGRDIADVVELMHLVEGLPLAIQLAAAGVRLMSVKEITGDLRRLIDLQNPRRASADENSTREQSLRACIGHSWRLLTGTEQKALSQLAIFAHGFRLLVALDTTDADMATIGSLCDKSLLRKSADGRFYLHSLIRYFALEHLQTEQEVRHRSATYFSQLMMTQASPDTDTSLKWHDEDVSNCIDAWRWAVRQRQLPILQQMAMPLLNTLGSRSRWLEGAELFAAAVTDIDDGFGDFANGLRAVLLNALARCQLNNGELSAAEENARHALRICRLQDVPLVMGDSLCSIAYVKLWRGELAAAKRFLEQSLRRARPARDTYTIARACYGNAYVEEAAGNWSVAKALHQENAVFCRGKRLYRLLAGTLRSLGNIHLAEKSAAEALACFDEGIELCLAHDWQDLYASQLTARGLALNQQGDLPNAKKDVAKSLHIAQQLNMPHIGIGALLAGCRLSLAERNAAQALIQIQAAMRDARKIESPALLLSAVLYWGEWLVQFGDSARGLAVLDFVRTNALALRTDQALAAAAIAAAPHSAKDLSEAKLASTAIVLSDIETEILNTEITH